MLKAIIFDFGNTLVEQEPDHSRPLGRMEMVPFPEVKTILERLAKRYTLVILTNTEQSSSRSVRVALRKLSFSRFFSIVVTSVDVGEKKPHPKMFREPMRRLGLKSDEVVMIGNDIREDIEGAKRLGIVSIWLDRNGEGIERATGKADFVARSLRDIPALIERIEERKYAGGAKGPTGGSSGS